MKTVQFLLIFAPIVSFAQNYQTVFDRYNPKYSFEWTGFEVPDDYETKIKFVDFVESNGLLQSELKGLEITDDQLRFQIHAVDLNNDRLAEIIYQGPHMGEGFIVHIFLQTPSGFRKIFTSRQGVVAVDWKGERLDKLYIKDWGCCADPNLVNSVYQILYSDAIPTFNLIWKSVELRSFVTKPKSWITSKRFEITNEKYKLRANPWIDDLTPNEFLGITGNTIGLLKQGYKGTAYATAEDETGRIWWYVLIDAEYELEDTYINYEHHDFKPHLLGWISSRYLDEIKN